MHTGHSPDSLGPKRLFELNNAVISNLEEAWPAAYDAIVLLNQRMEAGMLSIAESDLPDSALYDIVRWYLYICDDLTDA